MDFGGRMDRALALLAPLIRRTHPDVRGGEKRSHFRRVRTEPRNRIEAAVAECPPPVAADLTAPLAGTR